MARLAKASSDLGGDSAFRRIHQRILQHQANFDPAKALEFASSQGLNDQQLRAQIQSDAVAANLAENIQAVEAADIKWAGKLYVNGRRVTAPLPTRELLERIIAVAGGSSIP